MIWRLDIASTARIGAAAAHVKTRRREDGIAGAIEGIAPEPPTLRELREVRIASEENELIRVLIDDADGAVLPGVPRQTAGLAWSFFRLDDEEVDHFVRAHRFEVDLDLNGIVAEFVPSRRSRLGPPKHVRRFPDRETRPNDWRSA